MKDNLTSKNNSTACQRALILTYLQEHGSATTTDFRNMGIMSPAPRIMELKRQGYNIEKVLEAVIDHVGVKHGNVARYFLQGVADGES